MTQSRIQFAERIYKNPLMELIYRAHKEHQKYFNPNIIQKSSLLSIKTGGCPENCSYCPQSAHYKTKVTKSPLLRVEKVVETAKKAKSLGATRFCMGAAWREVKDSPEFDQVLEMVKAVKELNLEVCCTLGMLSEAQAVRLKDAGLYAYNHNIDTSVSYYKSIVGTRKFEDRLETIKNVRRAGLTVCTGGIIGLGESDSDRVSFLNELSQMVPHPESVTINALVPFAGTPLQHQTPISPLILVRVIATARILMPKSMIRLSAGRLELSRESQILCFFVGANSIFIGEKLLTSPNPTHSQDDELFVEAGLKGLA